MLKNKLKKNFKCGIKCPEIDFAKKMRQCSLQQLIKMKDENLNKNPLICQGLPLQGKEINTLICNISMSVVKPINLLSINTQYVGFSFLIQYDYKTEYS